MGVSGPQHAACTSQKHVEQPPCMPVQRSKQYPELSHVRCWQADDKLALAEQLPYEQRATCAPDT